MSSVGWKPFAEDIEVLERGAGRSGRVLGGPPDVQNASKSYRAKAIASIGEAGGPFRDIPSNAGSFGVRPINGGAGGSFRDIPSNAGSTGARKREKILVPAKTSRRPW